MNQRLLIYFILLISLKCAGQSLPNEKIKSFNELKNSFNSPSQHYGSAPLWVWNTKIDTFQIRDMLLQFKANSFGGVFIHPRAGLITPYLSTEWLKLYDYTVRLATKLQLDVWIYDENSYPSGFAGGLVPEQMPSSFNQGEMLQYSKVTKLPEDSGSYYLCLKKTDSGFTDTKNITREKNQTAEYFIFKKTLYYQSPWYGGFSYVDLMAHGVTEKFIELTMNPYEKWLGKEFGKTIRGVFSDEPNIEVQYPNSIRWTPDLFKYFQEKWGYDLKIHLPSLVEETGDWKKVRHNYYQTLLQLFIDRWSKPYSTYATRKNLEWTGHYWEHEWPSPNHGPDNMAMYAWPQRPGIDMLFNQFDEKDVNAQFGNVRSVKELSSVANQLNKHRTLSETYGGAGWELSFNDMKRLGDWEFVLGVNTLNQHLSFMSLAGARKYDYPQSFSYQTPWWPYYKYLNLYFARLSMSLSSGDQMNEILVIEPTTTAWMYFNYDKPDTVFKIMGNQFQHFITRLEKSQVEYDLGSENIIRDHGRTDSNQFIIGSRSYSTVVIPPGMENIDMPTFRFLNQFALSGGKVIQYSKLKTVDGAASLLLDAFYGKNYPGLVLKDSLEESDLKKYFGNDTFSIQPSENHTGDLYHQRRHLQDGEILFLANSSLSGWSSGQFNITGEKNVLLLDLFSGKTEILPVKINAGHTVVQYNIPPAGSQLYFITADKLTGYKNHIASSGEKKYIKSSPLRIQRKSDNSLTIDFCDLKIGDTLLKDVHVFDAADFAFKFHGFSDGNPWNTSVQFKDNSIRRDHFAALSGFTATYYFNITEDVGMTKLKAVVENPHLYRVRINDHDIFPDPGKWWMDKDFKVFNIGKFAHQGKNSLSITARPMSVFAEIEPVYILGNFGLVSSTKGWTITKPDTLSLGSWKKMGLPMFGQSISYTRKINIQKRQNKKWLVELDQWRGTAATITVNGKSAGIIAFAPFQLDISSQLQNGENTIEVTVIGSLKNVIGPFHRNPKPGLVSPWDFRYVTNYATGADYDLKDYGLLKDFNIVEF